MNDKEMAIKILREDKESFQRINHGGFNGKIKAFETAISALEQPTATEFLQKAKAICKDRDNIDGKCFDCPVISLCANSLITVDEADLVRKVMEYRIKEVSE